LCLQKIWHSFKKFGVIDSPKIQENGNNWFLARAQIIFDEAIDEFIKTRVF